jgi:hypothetical protein
MVLSIFRVWCFPPEQNNEPNHNSSGKRQAQTCLHQTFRQQRETIWPTIQQERKRKSCQTKFISCSKISRSAVNWTTQEHGLTLLIRDFESDVPNWQTIANKLNAECHNNENIREKNKVRNRYNNVLRPKRQHPARVEALEYIIDNYVDHKQKAEKALAITKAAIDAAEVLSPHEDTASITTGPADLLSTHLLTAPAQPDTAQIIMTTTEIFQYLETKLEIQALLVGFMAGHICADGGMDGEKMIADFRQYLRTKSNSMVLLAEEYTILAKLTAINLHGAGAEVEVVVDCNSSEKTGEVKRKAGPSGRMEVDE